MDVLMSHWMHLMKTCGLIQECFEKCCIKTSSGQLTGQCGCVRYDAAGSGASLPVYS